MPEANQVIKGKYKLVRLLGEGGMGAVWEGVHEIIGKKVAVKFLHPDYSKNQEAFQRFVREAQIASRIGHSSIIEIYDMDQLEDGTPFMVMEYLEGVSLEEYLKVKGKLSPRETIEILLPVLQALELAHQKGIIHRDLKPDNIFICDTVEGRIIKILDFGISKIVTDELKDKLTRTGVVMGTPYYMSPEQAKGDKNQDHRLDIYAIGVIMYECLCGKVPFRGDTYNEVLYKVLIEHPNFSLDFEGIEIPEKLLKIIKKAIEKEPSLRYQSCQELYNELNELLYQLKSKKITPAHGTPASLPKLTQVEIKNTNIYSTTSNNELSIPAIETVKTKKLIVLFFVLFLVGGVVITIVILFSNKKENTDIDSARSGKPSREENIKPTKKVDTLNERDSLPLKQTETQPLLLTKKKIKLLFQGAPPNSKIYLDNQLILQNPFEIFYDENQHELRVEAEGFKTYIANINFDKEREEQLLNISLEKIDKERKKKKEVISQKTKPTETEIKTIKSGGETLIKGRRGTLIDTTFK